LTRPVDVIERVGNWKQAFDAVAVELTPPETRELLRLMQTAITPEGPTLGANVALGLSRMVAANDRAAGTIAAMLVSTGIKPVAIAFGDEATDD
jgi:hypothetical protein